MKPTPNKIILDTNLLLLWLVARTDPRILQQYKRVNTFTYQDIELLREVLRPFKEFVTTPHILSETGNFLDQAPSWQRAALVDQFKEFIQSGVEIYRESTTLIAREEFNALGLTDTAMVQLSTEDTVILTVDYRLAGMIEALGGNAINFNHYRTSLLN